jgi:DNA primase
MFPIHDARGRTVGFGGRILGDGEPKYLNSPEGPVFHKGRLLYNLHRAAPAARKSGRLLVVEGYMDVVGLAGAGVMEAVAPLGTALTEEQMALAWKLVPEPCLAFDGDGAGMRAGLRAATRALPLIGPGRSLAFVALPRGQDPDDLARSGGAAAVEALLKTAVPLERFLFEAEAAAQPLDTPERRAAFRARLKALAAEIADPDLKRDYLATWLGRADELLRPARPAFEPRPARGLARGNWQAPIPPARPETRAAAGTPNELVLGMLLKRLSGDSDAVEMHLEALAEMPIRTPTLLRARDHLLAGRSAEELLRGYRPLSLGGDTAPEKQARLAATLASLAESHHIAGEGRQPSEPSSADSTLDSWDEAFERNRQAALAHGERIRLKAALGNETDQA